MKDRVAKFVEEHEVALAITAGMVAFFAVGYIHRKVGDGYRVESADIVPTTDDGRKATVLFLKNGNVRILKETK